MEELYDNLPYGKHPLKNKAFGKMDYNKTIRISKRNSNMDSNLGFYYLDLTPSMIDYKEFRYGEFDENGVPMIGWGKHAKYNAVNIAQYGLIIHDLWWKNKKQTKYLNFLYVLLQWFEKNKEEYKDSVIWREKEDNKRYNLKAGFVSAMTQGEIISFYLRMYQISGNEHLLNTALKTYSFFKIEVKEGGFKRYDENGYLWFEEYPSEKPSFVLNGFIYALFGLYDLYRVTKDSKINQDIISCIETLKYNIHKYDVGYWSVYDQLTKELVMVYYQRNAHVPQLDVLYDITREDIFKFYSGKWQKNINFLNILFVKIMYRVRPRIFKLKKLFLKY